MSKSIRWAGTLTIAAILSLQALGCGGGGGHPETTPPQLTGAAATSNTTVLLSFSEPMAASAGDAVHYRLSPNVVITGAQLNQYGTQVLLTTLPLTTGVEYTVTANDLTDRVGNVIDPAAKSVTFLIPPSDPQAPRMLSAVATSATTVLVTFSEPMEEATGDPVHYALDPGGVITNAELSEFQTQVLLTTLPLAPGVTYTLTATGVRDQGRNPIDPASQTVTFSYGPRAADTRKPRVLGGKATSPTTVIIFFSEPMQPSATNPANYTFQPSLAVNLAQFNENHTQVLLTTAPMSPGVSYSIDITNVVDLSGNGIEISVTPPVVSYDPAVPDTDPPTILGAVAISDTTVLVTFSEPMDDDAGDPVHYELTPGGTVTTAQLTAFRTQVILTVLPLSPGSVYDLNATDITDLAGNPLSLINSVPVSFGHSIVDVDPPRIIRAVATSATTILVSFSEPMDDSAGDAVHYDLTPGGTITTAQLSQYKTQVLLTVLPLTPGAVYTVVVDSIFDAAGNAIDPGGRTATVTFGQAPADTTPPSVINVVATSSSTILLFFNEPVQSSAANPGNYTLTPNIVVTQAQLNENSTQVLLTTGAPLSPNVTYNISITNITDLSGNTVTPTAVPPTVGFDPSVPDTKAPRVLGAVAISNTRLLVTFNEPMSAATADPVHYQVTPGVTIVAAQLSEFKTQVFLTVLPLTPGTVYTVTANNVSDAAGNAIDPAANVAVIPFGPTLSDITPPRIISAVATSPTTILVSFSEPVHETAGDPVRYTLAPNGVVIGAQLSPFKTQVLLTTLPLVPGRVYVLRAPTIIDGAGNTIAASAASANVVLGAIDTGAPRLVSAVATSATTLLVTFSEAMDDPAGDPIHYALLPGGVVTAAELSQFKTQVLLTTLPLTPGVTYALTVSDVKDQSLTSIDPSARTVTFSYGPPIADTRKPRALGATATSSTTILVFFSEPVQLSATNPANYTLSPDVTVTRAQLDETRTQVQLTTAPLAAGISYSIGIQNVFDIAGNAIEPTAIPLVVRFDPTSPDTEAPRILGIVALSSTSLLVTFSEPMDDGAGDASRYQLSPDVTVTAAQLSTFKTQVILTVQPLVPGTVYNLGVSNVTDVAGNALNLANSATSVSVGNPIVDTDLPRIIRAVPTSATTILVSFSEPMADIAGDAVHYDLAPGGVVVAAQLSQFRTQVLLTVLPLTPGTQYTLTASGITDLAGNPIDPTADEATLAFGPTPGDAAAPVVLSAVATSQTTVVVSFNEPVQATALNTTNYNLSPNVAILQAQFNETHTQVLLTTAPLASGVSYEVTVQNIADLSGNVIATVSVGPTVQFDPNVPDTAAPRVLGAVAISNSSLLVTFSEPMASATGDPVHYQVTPGVTITAAQLSQFKTQVILTVLPLAQGTVYTVTVTGITDIAGNPIDPTANVAVASFGPAVSDTTAPRVLSAVPTSSTTILVSFSEPMHETTGDPVRYTLLPGGVITAAQLTPFATQVLLTTLPLTPGRTYTLSAPTLIDAAGNIVAPNANTAMVVLGPADNRPPRLLNAIIVNNTTILLTFSEPLGPGADNPALYGLTPTINILDAQINDAGTQVFLTTMPLQQNITYTIIVNGVTDMAGNPIQPMMMGVPVAPSDTPEGTADEPLPRLVSGASFSNTTVLVQFSRAMGPSAEVASAYVITQENVHTEAGRLIVTKAQFVDQNDKSTVRLTTLSQNEVIYRLRVAGVSDTKGNPLAQTQVAGGVVIDSSTTTFPGTPPSCAQGRSCANGSTGIGGTGACADDTDCPCPANAQGCSVTDACVDNCNLRDSDGDGLSDNVEQAGWVVTVQNTNGTTTERQVTSDPRIADTDGDGLDDRTELQILSDPRRPDTDGDGLDDNEEYNVVYSDPTRQDSDGDGIDDKLEVELFKTNALVADSDGDGYSDPEELFEMGRDPRIADLPRYEITVGSVRLQIDERFTTTDESGNTQTETSSTATSLENDSSSSSSKLEQSVGHFMVQIEGGIDSCQAEAACDAKGASFLNAARAKAIATLGGGAEFTTASTTESARATMSAFQTSLDKGRESSAGHSVTREVVGASLSAEVTLANPSDIAFRLSNLEIRVATTDPLDPTRLVPVATLFPDSTLQTGNPAEFNIGPSQTRGPVIFSNRDVFPSLVEDLMRSPRGLVFTVANFDQTTADGRNFAFGLQQVRERTAQVSFDFGDGELKELNAITAGVLNRPRDQMRCGPSGDHPDYSCVADADCGTSAPCEGGKIVGGFSRFGGTGRPAGVPLDFILRDILQMRRETPAVIMAGPNLRADTTAQGDDVQVVKSGDPTASAGTVVIAPGRNGVLDTKPGGDDFNSQGPRIVAGTNGVADTAKSGDDVQVVPVGTHNLAADTVVIAPGLNGRVDTIPAGNDNDDEILGPDGILPGRDGAVQSVAQGDDVQLVPVATTGVPEDVVVISAGQNGVLDTPLPTGSDDVAAVVTGYEVSKTCNASTPFAILAGRNRVVETKAETGICTIASPPHFVGESCSRTGDNPDSGCGVSTNAPASFLQNSVTNSVCRGGDIPGAPCTQDTDCTNGGTCGAPMKCFGGSNPGAACSVEGDCMGEGTCSVALTLVDATAFPASGIIAVGSQEARYTNKNGNDLALTTLAAPIPAGTAVTLVTGRCTADQQVKDLDFGKIAPSSNTVVVTPSSAGFLATVPGGDDIYVAPGISCTQDEDCTAGDDSGQCTGPQNVVRVEQRRNGQFRRFWALLLSDGTQIQTDFGALMVRPGDSVALAFIQDIDRDGLIAQEEFLHRSSDFKKDTDGDTIGDFAEIRLGWDVGVVGQPIRHVFSDPSLRDSDGDGLSDRDEQDVRITQCACNAKGPKSLLGSGSLLRGDVSTEAGAQPCRTDDDCVGKTPGSCVDAAHCAEENNCPPCGADVTQNRTDPRLSDTDVDGITDSEEVFGYLTGAGIVDAGDYTAITAGQNLRADTVACPQNYCVEDADKRVCATGGASCSETKPCQAGVLCIPPSTGHCTTDGDCFSHNCIHPVKCDDVQVVPPGTGVRDAHTVVVAPGPLGSKVTKKPGTSKATGDDDSGPGNKKADSLLQGDDPLVVGLGESTVDGTQCVDGGTFLLCSAIKPGVDGRIDSVRAGDDLIIPGGLGQRLEVSDPLSPDTDMDRVSDGNEQILGTSPNLPGDAVLGGDLDADGLTDVLEGGGWKVRVTNILGVTSDNTVKSNPRLPDTDLDGLPDYAERYMPCTIPPTCDMGKCSNDASVSCMDSVVCNVCPTDPTKPDTDGDGISDFDELSAAQFAALTRFNDFFPGYHVDGLTSKQYGTDPTKVDTDDDTLSDSFELFVGWTVLRDDGTVQRVFSDPTTKDTDADGLKDNEELQNKTDPGDPDTDGDGRLDGFETTVGTDPLHEDIFVSVTYSVMQLTGPRDGSDRQNEWTWRLAAQTAGGTFPGTILSTDQTDCPTGFADTKKGPAGCATNAFNFSLNRSTPLKLRPGEAIVLNGLIVEIGFADQPPRPIDNVEVDACLMSFIDTPITYDNLKSTSFITRTFNPAAVAGDETSKCSAVVLAEIAVNCVGNGRSLCQVGNACLANEDCRSGACSTCKEQNGRIVCDGIGACQSDCGNGIREFAPETLSPEDARICLNSPFGVDFLKNCEGCDDGNDLRCGTCSTGCRADGAQPKTCPAGTGCNDPLVCEGTCDLLAHVCVGCTTDGDCTGVCDKDTGKCMSICGNGNVEPGEQCDDNNMSNCGTCDATCSASGHGSPCEIGVGCSSNADCLSNVCGADRKCTGLSPGSSCTQDGQCESSFCDDHAPPRQCAAKKGLDEVCYKQSACLSGSCQSGRCKPVCGNGLVEALESCDDNNNDACGTCNANCSGIGSGADCPKGMGCSQDDDCASMICGADGKCVAPTMTPTITLTRTPTITPTLTRTPTIAHTATRTPTP